METDCVVPFEASISVSSPDAFFDHGHDVMDSLDSTSSTLNNDDRTEQTLSEDAPSSHDTSTSHVPKEIVASEYQLPVTEQTTSGVSGGNVDTKEQSNGYSSDSCVPKEADTQRNCAPNDGVATITNASVYQASLSGTSVDVRTPTVARDDVVERQADGDGEWRQSNSFESHASSVCSIDTVQGIQAQLSAIETVEGGHQTSVPDKVTTEINDGGQLQSTIPSDHQPLTTDLTSASREPEVPQAEFTTGITCCDVPTALDILNTRYRLADVTIHKNMITWSSWNIADMVRGPHRESFWWRGKRRGRYVPLSSTNVDTVDQDVATSTSVENSAADVSLRDIEALCEKIEHKEREIELILQRDERRQRDAAAATAAAADVPVVDEVVAVETVPVMCAAAPSNDATNTEVPPQQKRENLFQRLLRALRQRFTRQQRQQQQPEQASDSAIPQDKREDRRKRRTL